MLQTDVSILIRSKAVLLHTSVRTHITTLLIERSLLPLCNFSLQAVLLRFQAKRFTFSSISVSTKTLHGCSRRSSHFSVPRHPIPHDSMFSFDGSNSFSIRYIKNNDVCVPQSLFTWRSTHTNPAISTTNSNLYTYKTSFPAPTFGAQKLLQSSNTR